VGYVAHDAGVAGLRQDERRLLEARGVVLSRGLEELERHAHPGMAIARLVDDAHAAVAGEALHFEAFGDDRARLHGAARRYRSLRRRV
jgi:hypothetical protein